MDWSRKKSITLMQEEKDTSFKRVLNIFDLTAIGLGGIIGVGAFVLIGIAAASTAGPAVAISFVIAGLASAAAALCYAEFAGLIPVTGSAYTYSYAVMGEFAAWMIGWALLLEYTLVVTVVAIGWSGYFQSLLSIFGVQLPLWMQGSPGTGVGHHFNLFAFLVTLGISTLLIFGMDIASRFNNAIVSLKMGIILLIIGVGAFFVEPANWHPFMPFGFEGVISAASLVFFAVFGYDTLTTAAEDAKNPQRDLPRAIMFSLIIALFLYIGISLVLTGIVPYPSLNNAAPAANAFAAIGLKWVTFVIAIAAVAGIMSVLFAFILAGSRVWFSMARDGLLPSWFAKPHPKYKTPYRPTIIMGIVTSIGAGLAHIKEMAELVNIVVLTSFIMICISVIMLRVSQPNLPRNFRTPLVPYVPIIGIAFSCWLLINLPGVTWVRFLIWMVVGLIIYIVYSYRNSKLAKM